MNDERHDGQRVPSQLLAWAKAAENVTVLSGAGMSAESGVPTFRDAQTGLWSQFDAESLATPEAFEADPALVWAWYLWRARLARDVKPNPGHLALARWARAATVRIVTQNVDDLHERAGSLGVEHVHGSLFAFRCARCERPADVALESVLPHEVETERLDPPRCEHCDGLIRPGVVWFGEALPEGSFERAVDAVGLADLVLVVGTSGMVYPAAALPGLANRAGIPTVELDPDETALSDEVSLFWRTTAGVGLPALVDAVLG